MVGRQDNVFGTVWALDNDIVVGAMRIDRREPEEEGFVEGALPEEGAAGRSAPASFRTGGTPQATPCRTPGDPDPSVQGGSRSDCGIPRRRRRDPSRTERLRPM